MDVLGVDIGGVIIDNANDGTDTSFFSGNYLKTTAVPGAVEALGRLVRECFHGSVFLVSKCRERTEMKTREWLLSQRFYEETGISPEHVRFCRTREGKAPICRELGVTHFVDDRLEVLSYLTTVPHRFLFRGRPKESQKFVEHLENVTQVRTWREITEALL